MENNISELNYMIKQYKILHNKKQNYGKTSEQDKRVKIIQEIIDEVKPTSLLDYGCGKSSMIDKIHIDGFIKHKYDPAINKFKNIPLDSYDIITNTDVMEHIPESGILYILNDINRLTNNVLFIISTKKACIKLPNGQNCHVTIKSKDWWLNTISNIFNKASIINKYTIKNLVCIKTW